MGVLLDSRLGPNLVQGAIALATGSVASITSVIVTRGEIRLPVAITAFVVGVITGTLATGAFIKMPSVHGQSQEVQIRRYLKLHKRYRWSCFLLGATIGLLGIVMIASFSPKPSGNGVGIVVLLLVLILVPKVLYKHELERLRCPKCGLEFGLNGVFHSLPHMCSHCDLCIDERAVDGGTGGLDRTECQR